MRSPTKILFPFLFFAGLSKSFSQQPTSIQIAPAVKTPVPSVVAFTSKINKKEKLGVLFVLPFTGGESSQFMRVYFHDWNTQMNLQADYDFFVQKLGLGFPIILVMVSGNTSTQDHDAKGFADAIARFDSQIKQDLAGLEKTYTIDKSKLYLTGFSLGGDLSWAISQKNPGMFKGAVIAGSRCGFRSSEGYTRLRSNNFKVYLAAGQNELEVIQQGVELAKSELLSNKIEHMYYEIPGVAHKMIPEDRFLEALRFVLAHE